MADGRPPLVDYERAARTYERGRALTAESMSRWREAVRARLGDAPPRCVVDVGAGTGIFVPMWLELGTASVVAVEPSEAMRAQAAMRSDPRVRVQPGTAADLGLADASADVVWLSAVIHHFPDLNAALLEMRRVLRPGGRLMVRGYFPDHSTIPWLDALPGAERARARFPTTGRLAQALAPAGFTILDVVGVPDPEQPRAREAADWIAAMRHADTILTALRDDEIEAGIATLRARGEDRLEPLRLTLVTALVE
jgi:SAM-dependent methyltransferase